MKKITLFAIFCCFSAQANLLNYKNINTVGAIVCKNLEPMRTLSKGEQLVSKFRQDKTLTGEKTFEIELTGTCNAIVKSSDHSSNSEIEVNSLGREITLNFDSQSQTAQGKVGLIDIKVKYDNQSIQSIELKDMLLGEKKDIRLNSAQWSPNNMIITTKPIQILLKNGDKLIEKDSALLVAGKSKLFNLWNFESFSCSKRINQSQCSQLVRKI